MRVHKEMLARWGKFCDLYIRELGYGQSAVDVKTDAYHAEYSKVVD